MKRVSFKIAKVIKEAGYPQLGVELWYTIEGKYIDGVSNERYAICPTYFEVWCWLWKEKNIQLQPTQNVIYIWPKGILIDNNSDVEDGIITAINYLVDNNLIK